ncbi:alcohol dehydrogenase catalytic domain-containing protein [Algoriphagus litoralis]|uniref:alcohol dehydrogenase catalytic domain-containing protein n=1 Tax=Algoriphagus litoralis TaxID=2202829 RepID=UPI000DB9519A|nr:alcohol dehydrogenase catalytic domain-containing protein [Algoriphagus litoralis]
MQQSPTAPTISEQKTSPEEYFAAQLISPKKLQFVALKKPCVEKYQVLVRIQGSGLCVSDLPYWLGQDRVHYPLQPGRPGHEGWGEIVEIGSKVSYFKVGNQVTFVNDLTFAEYAVVEESQLLALPDELKNQPFPGQAFGSILNVFQRAEINQEDSVAIIGQDLIARGVLQLCLDEGTQVLVVSSSQAYIKEASEYTPHCVFAEDLDGINQDSKLLNGTDFFTRVIECSGKQSTLNLATSLAAPYGKVILAGYHLGGIRQIDLQSCYNKSLDIINAHEVSEENIKKGMIMATAAILEGNLNPFKLLTKVYPFRALEEAFTYLENSEQNEKIYLDMSI